MCGLWSYSAVCVSLPSNNLGDYKYFPSNTPVQSFAFQVFFFLSNPVPFKFQSFFRLVVLLSNTKIFAQRQRPAHSIVSPSKNVPLWPMVRSTGAECTCGLLARAFWSFPGRRRASRPRRRPDVPKGTLYGPWLRHPHQRTSSREKPGQPAEPFAATATRQRNVDMPAAQMFPFSTTTAWLS
jgi:hypothetical protein